jgi:hypothetical protein
MQSFILWCLGTGDVFMSATVTSGRQRVLRFGDSTTSEYVAVGFYGMI